MRISVVKRKVEGCLIGRELGEIEYVLVRVLVLRRYYCSFVDIVGLFANIQVIYAS